MRFMNSKITANRGVPQGSVLSPHLFNIYLNHLLSGNKTLAEAIRDGKLVAFADDILMIADDQKEAEDLIGAIETLSENGIFLNKDKSKILTNQEELQGKTEIAGVKIEKKIKYLGVLLSCSRD